MSPPGLSIETAASVTLLDFIKKHMSQFALVIRRDRAAGISVSGAYVEGLAGALSLTIAGGHGSREEVLAATYNKLCEKVDRDLRLLAGQ